MGVCVCLCVCVCVCVCVLRACVCAVVRAREREGRFVVDSVFIVFVLPPLRGREREREGFSVDPLFIIFVPPPPPPPPTNSVFEHLHTLLTRHLGSVAKFLASVFDR